MKSNHSLTSHIPGVGTFVECHDDTEVKATALRLGVLDKMTQSMKAEPVTPGGRCACSVARDGGALVMTTFFAGFDDPVDNGWSSVRVTPANALTAALLVRASEEMMVAEGGKPAPKVRWCETKRC